MKLKQRHFMKTHEFPLHLLAVRGILLFEIHNVAILVVAKPNCGGIAALDVHEWRQVVMPSLRPLLRVDFEVL